MIRTFLGLIAGVVAGGGAVLLGDRPGTVTLVWQGWRLETSFAVLVLALVLAAGAIWLILTLLARLIAAPGRIARRRRENRHLQGYRAITDGLVAIAAGDLRTADRLRLRA